ncbi:MAG: phosphotransferase [Chloroflexota bacterium]|nr:phosphotransferase [Chloroflexota bacterium]
MPLTPPPHPLPPLNAALAQVGLEPERILALEPLLDGLSGADLARVRLRTPAGAWPGAPDALSSRVVKRIAAESGWLGAATHDTRMREAALWRAGLPRWLPHNIALATERAAFTTATEEAPATATLLMRDERSRLLPTPYATPPGHLPAALLPLLDALAALHARFWQAPLLGDDTLGLASPRDTLLWLSPQAIAAARAAGETQLYLALAERGWQAFFRLAPAAEAATLGAIFAAPEPILAAIGRLPRTLVHGDIWGPNIGWLPPTHRAPRLGRRLLLLDWSLAAAAPAPYDVLSLCGAWPTLRPIPLLAAYRARLARRLAARGLRLAAEEWQALADAAYLRAALLGGEAWARNVEDAPSRPARQAAQARLDWWTRRGARAAQRLLGG